MLYTGTSPLPHTEDIFDTVDFSRRNFSEEGEGSPKGRKDDDHRFQGVIYIVYLERAKRGQGSTMQNF